MTPPPADRPGAHRGSTPAPRVPADDGEQGRRGPGPVAAALMEAPHHGRPAHRNPRGRRIVRPTHGRMPCRRSLGASCPTPIRTSSHRPARGTVSTRVPYIQPPRPGTRPARRGRLTATPGTPGRPNPPNGSIDPAKKVERRPSLTPGPDRSALSTRDRLGSYSGTMPLRRSHAAEGVGAVDEGDAAAVGAFRGGEPRVQDLVRRAAAVLGQPELVCGIGNVRCPPRRWLD